MRREIESMDDSAALLAQVDAALHDRQPLRIRGGDTKAFLGRPVAAREIDTRGGMGVRLDACVGGFLFHDAGVGGGAMDAGYARAVARCVYTCSFRKRVQLRETDALQNRTVRVKAK